MKSRHPSIRPVRVFLPAAILALHPVHADLRSGGASVILSDTISSGGTVSASGGFTITSSVGEIGGPVQQYPAAPAAAQFTLKPAFPGSVFEVVNLTLTAAPPSIAANGGVSTLTLLATLDDGSQIYPDFASVFWSVPPGSPVTGPVVDPFGSGATLTAGPSIPSVVVPVSASFVRSTAATTSVTVVGSDDGIADAWQQAYGIVVLTPGRDLDHDGLDDVLEAAFNLDPNKADNAIAATGGSVLIGGQRYLQLTYRTHRGHNPARLSLSVERGTQFPSWSSTGLVEVSHNDLTDGITREITVRSTTPIASGTREYLRVKATYNP